MQAVAALFDFPSEADSQPGVVPNDGPPAGLVRDLWLRPEAQAVIERASDGQTARPVEVARREAVQSAGLRQGRDASSKALAPSRDRFAGQAGDIGLRARDSRAVQPGRKSPVTLVAAVFLVAVGGATWLGWQWRMPPAQSGSVIADATAVLKYDGQPSSLESFERRAAAPLMDGSSVRTVPTSGNQDRTPTEAAKVKAVASSPLERPMTEIKMRPAAVSEVPPPPPSSFIGLSEPQPAEARVEAPIFGPFTVEPSSQTVPETPEIISPPPAAAPMPIPPAVPATQPAGGLRRRSPSPRQRRLRIERRSLRSPPFEPPLFPNLYRTMSASSTWCSSVTERPTIVWMPSWPRLSGRA